MNKRLHIILGRTLITLLVTAGGLMLLSAVKTKDAKPCEKVEISYRNGQTSGFLPEKDILGLISGTIEEQPVGAALEKFDLKKIEFDLEKNPWVYDAQLYFDNRQTLHVLIDEAVPVARIMDAKGNQFYLDRRANELPLSTSYRSDLPVFTGIPSKRNHEEALKKLQRIVELGEAISRDSFWLAQAAQIDVQPNGTMELVPAFGNHIVDIGYASQPKIMLERLKQFYVAMAEAGKLDAYTRVIARFDKQIIGQRSNVNEPEKTERKMAMETYQKIVEQNKQVVNANSVTTENTAGRIMAESSVEKEKVMPRKKEIVNEPRPVENIESQKTQDKSSDKPPENSPEQTPQKKPKAIMPKLEKN
ncbi:MAG: hypothetical protein MUE99_00020 [Chitinophagaceae bacterium]|nr:hypothetical protein [Chitinophagaceae bacterium]